MRTISKTNFWYFRLTFFGIVSSVLIILLSWQHFHEGIPAHHFLAKKNMPLISNAWGGLAIPLFTWLMLWQLEKRLFADSTNILFPISVLSGFIGALVYGIVLGFCIQEGIKLISSHTPWFIILVALILPIYRAEYFLGFVLGLTYWVGGLLPIVVGAVFLLVAFAIYHYVRNPILKLWCRLVK